MTDIQTSVHGSRLGLGPSNELMVQRPDTGQSVDIGNPFYPVYRQYKQVTSAQVLALHATPISIIAAQGAGKAIVPVQVKIYKPAGTAYAAVAAGEDLVLKYTNASGAQCSAVIETTGFLDQTTAQTRVASFLGSTGSTAGDVTPVANAAVVLHLLVGEITTGDSPLHVEVIYSVTDVTFTS